MEKALKNKVFVSLIGIIVSLILLLINEHCLKADAFWYNLVLVAATALLTNTFILLISAFLRDNQEEKINEIAAKNFSVLKSCQEYGLVGIYDEFPLKESFIADDFINSKAVFIVMNDGKQFISRNTPLLRQRVKSKNTSTTFVLLDYEEEDLMNVLARRYGRKADYYRNKIKDVIEYNIKALKSEKDESHGLSVYLNRSYNTYSIILTDHYAMVSLYRVNGRRKTGVPHFVFNSDANEYDKISKDIEGLVEQLSEKVIL